MMNNYKKNYLIKNLFRIIILVLGLGNHLNATPEPTSEKNICKGGFVNFYDLTIDEINSPGKYGRYAPFFNYLEPTGEITIQQLSLFSTLFEKKGVGNRSCQKIIGLALHRDKLANDCQLCNESDTNKSWKNIVKTMNYSLEIPQVVKDCNNKFLTENKLEPVRFNNLKLEHHCVGDEKAFIQRHFDPREVKSLELPQNIHACALKPVTAIEIYQKEGFKNYDEQVSCRQVMMNNNFKLKLGDTGMAITCPANIEINQTSLNTSDSLLGFKICKDSFNIEEVKLTPKEDEGVL